MLRQLRNIIVFLLLVAAAISFFLGDTLEGLAVLAVVVLNTLFGFITEYRAEKSVEALQQMVKPRPRFYVKADCDRFPRRKWCPVTFWYLRKATWSPPMPGWWRLTLLPSTKLF
ncbi:MAG: hypothetical protein AB7D06_14630 [Pedobacter sp.]